MTLAFQEYSELIILTGALILGVVYGLPAVMERRGSLWKDLSEERQVALEKAIEQLKQRDVELLAAKSEIQALSLKTDLSALQEGITKEREQGVLLMKTELAKIQQATINAEERILATYDAHELRATERHEKVLVALEALTKKIQNGH
jgi:Tfp pilus assembly ATPase PilU